MSQPDPDPLDSLLSLEETYHTEGYNLGLADGARAGRIEGRVFGLGKGYEKFLELGKLGGRAVVWSARLSSSNPPSTANSSSAGQGLAATDVAATNALIPPLEASERMRRHVARMCDLTDASTLPTENCEDAVEEVEGRLKDARAKATLISKAVGEDAPLDALGDASDSRAKATGSKGLRVRSEGKKNGRGGGGEMEDFSGVLPISKSRTNRENDG